MMNHRAIGARVRAVTKSTVISVEGCLPRDFDRPH
jgi:hypothetical protein